MTTVGSIPNNLAPSNETSSISSALAADDTKPGKPLARAGDESPSVFLQACSKLDMEPNPFEQSFSGHGSGKPGATTGGTEARTETPKPVLPSIASMSGRLAPVSDQYGWNSQSLRMGPLSPSMLEGPQNPIVFDENPAPNPSPLSSFQAVDSMGVSFGSGSSIAENNLPYTGLPGPLPAPPQMSGMAPQPTYPPTLQNNGPGGNSNGTGNNSNNNISSHLSQTAQHGSVSGNGQGARAAPPFSHPNAQNSTNDRYIPPGQAAGPSDYGNEHLANQSQATQREAWARRENMNHVGNPAHHPSAHARGLVGAVPGPPGPPGPAYSTQPPHHGPQPGQSVPGMAGRPLPPKDNGDMMTMPRGERRSRVESDNSDDSEGSGQSGNGDPDAIGSSSNSSNKKRQAMGTDKVADEDEKRKNFLERNRQAALKCRQRKKQWLTNLQAKVEYLTADNEHLQGQVAVYRDEVIHLKALLLAHKECPVAQANGVYPDSIGVVSRGGGMTSHGRPPPHMSHVLPPHAGRVGPGPGPGNGLGHGGRGPLPPPLMHHPPGPGPSGSRMANPNMASSAMAVGPMVAAVIPPPGSGAGGSRPMPMMQDITPSVSPSQAQPSMRY